MAWVIITIQTGGRERGHTPQAPQAGSMLLCKRAEQAHAARSVARWAMPYQLLRHKRGPRERRNVLEVPPPPVAKPGRLDRADVQHTSHLIQHERGEGLARHVVGDDE